MKYLLGVDTGGTYTDAAIMDEAATQVVGKAKSLTTRADLSLGIGRAVDAALAAAQVAPADVAMVSLSTTLATNALVEGQGGRVALVFIGFDAADLERGGLTEALGGDPVIRLAGGHEHSGAESAPLDLATLEAEAARLAPDVMGFAVAARFATRNPAHEVAARAAIRAATGRPVTCSHELSAGLNGPKRALTAVLNARLIGMIDRLVAACERHLAAVGIDAPLMVVRGDGALISAAMVRERPIETILSGPAASIVGARWLTGEPDALVSDIGGTTTDVALLKDGLPEIDPEGARVGGFRTMVEAVAMRTTGLGGDSEVHLLQAGLEGGLRLGPRRLVPVSLLAVDHAEMVHAALDRALSAEVSGDFDGRFVIPMQGQTGGLTAREAALLARIDAPMPMARPITSRLEVAAMDRLVARGLVMISGVTPSDASHVLGGLADWDALASEKALRLLGRRRTGRGERFATDPAVLARMIVDQLTAQTVDCLLEAAFAEDPAFAGEAPEVLARHLLTRQGLARHRGVVDIGLRLAVPVIGLGASAPFYYGAVGDRLGSRMILPEHAGVANAIGAVVGQVSQRATGLVTSPGEGRFIAHLPAGNVLFSSADSALAALETALADEARSRAARAGAEEVHIATHRDIREAEVEGNRMFLEATLSVIASGRPRVAHD
ncbi:N-methylhydantoinase A/oxoprolinase/acetone carboxylase beta subunit [Gemmobacter caeni]|uniref:N-methylhydantoinase A/oxoprolinase/acetone carboxylase beta subunit n=1 Tax=Gemmobacter caeni TaxID=589035 RepID=A0A2T6AZ99_9RHOB|nr:hydantoinase/oxoprolinase family protein [Gemmobacter caeni]PTX49130.1 N-methylhydantoinase A/oxoprolinase/acetone carboxylase beta subunit [Gemmobacter caeni]TWI93467.1 N-methylhydantoinase A/oxoprolinase/acetone carboxylase beta subunit [Gemmobacter caeni]